MNDRFAKIISTIFHPIFIPIYGIILLIHLDYFLSYLPIYKAFIIFIVAFFTCLIPLIYTFFLIKKGYVENWQIEKRQERNTIYLITLISLLVCIYMLWKIHLPYWIILIGISSFLTLFSIAIINIFWKISLHAAAIGSFTGGMFLINYFMQTNPVWFFILILIIGGLVSTARLQLQAHTIGQTISGYFLGIFYLCIFPFFF